MLQGDDLEKVRYVFCFVWLALRNFLSTLRIQNTTHSITLLYNVQRKGTSGIFKILGCSL